MNYKYIFSVLPEHVFVIFQAEKKHIFNQMKNKLYFLGLLCKIQIERKHTKQI